MDLKKFEDLNFWLGRLANTFYTKQSLDGLKQAYSEREEKESYEVRMQIGHKMYLVNGNAAKAIICDVIDNSEEFIRDNTIDQEQITKFVKTL